MQNNLKKEKIEYELILVGNYIENYPDKTPEIIKDYSKKHTNIVTVTNKKKGGMGWDAITGFNKCSGDSIAFIDGDGQYPSKDIVRVYKIFQIGEFDFVKTYRKQRFDGFFRKMQSNLFNLFFKILFPFSQFKDINSKPKIFSSKAYKIMNLKCPGWFLDGEIILEVSRLKLSYAEIPTVFKKNEFRGSFINKSAIVDMIYSLIVYRLLYFFKNGN